MHRIFLIIFMASIASHNGFVLASSEASSASSSSTSSSPYPEHVRKLSVEVKGLVSPNACKKPPVLCSTPQPYAKKPEFELSPEYANQEYDRTIRKALKSWPEIVVNANGKSEIETISAHLSRMRLQKSQSERLLLSTHKQGVHRRGAFSQSMDVSPKEQ